MDPLTTIFEHMDRWRHLPAYQLERRADIFFSAYLAEVITQTTGTPVSPRMIPELPIKRDLIWPDKKTSSSVKVDYCLLAEDRSRAFLVELKTDVGSRREAQDTYLERAREVGFRSIVEGVVEISRSTSAHQKYGHLLHLLAEHSCVRLPPGYADHLWPRVRVGLGRLLQDVEVTVEPDELAIEVVYVQPTDAGPDGVDFEEFAAIVELQHDPVSRLFAQHLRRWVGVAGHRQPPQAT